MRLIEWLCLIASIVAARALLANPVYLSRRQSIDPYPPMLPAVKVAAPTRYTVVVEAMLTRFWGSVMLSLDEMPVRETSAPEYTSVPSAVNAPPPDPATICASLGLVLTCVALVRLKLRRSEEH